MLGKLIKHELKATSKLLLPIFLILAVFTIMDRIVLSLDIFKGVFLFIPAIITAGFVFCIIAVNIVSFVIIIIRFYKNLVKDEGYLMFTLPAKPYQLINSKLIVATLWTIASIAASALAIFIVATTHTGLDEIMNGFQSLINGLNDSFGSYGILFITELIVLILLAIINSILFVYVSIAIGQLFNGHKLLGAILSYVGINVALQIGGSILLVMAGLLFEDYIYSINSVPQFIFPITIVMTLLLSTAYYLITDLIFRKKLNLD